MPKYIREISASDWFYYKEICYGARSHERERKLYAIVTRSAAAPLLLGHVYVLVHVPYPSREIYHGRYQTKYSENYEL